VLFSVYPNISFPCETLLFTVVEGASDLGLCLTGHIPNIVRAKEVVKKEHISIPSIPGPQSRFDVNKTRMFAIYIGHNVPNFAPVVQKGPFCVWRSCRHFLIHSFIILRRIFSFRFDGNLRANTIIQCCSSDTILGGKILFDLLQGPSPVFVVYFRFLGSLLEANFMALLVMITADQNLVDFIGNGLTLDPFHMLQVIHTMLEVSHCPDGYRYPIVT
jgi:hypothetical protein